MAGAIPPGYPAAGWGTIGSTRQCQFFLALVSWMLGYPDRSLEELRAAVGSAETLGHPLTLAQTLCYGVLIHVLRHELPAASAYAERALRICEEQRISQYHAVALCLNGWALRASGESEKGLAQIAQGVDIDVPKKIREPSEQDRLDK